MQIKDQLILLVFFVMLQTKSLFCPIFTPDGWRHHILEFNKAIAITEQEAKKKEDFIDIYNAFKKAKKHLNVLLNAKEELENSTATLDFFLSNGLHLYMPGRVRLLVVLNNYQNAQLLIDYIKKRISEIDKELAKLELDLNI